MEVLQLSMQSVLCAGLAGLNPQDKNVTFLAAAVQSLLQQVPNKPADCGLASALIQVRRDAS